MSKTIVMDAFWMFLFIYFFTFYFFDIDGGPAVMISIDSKIILVFGAKHRPASRTMVQQDTPIPLSQTFIIM